MRYVEPIRREYGPPRRAYRRPKSRQCEKYGLAWLEREIAHGWASCPIIENGVIRIMSQPAYPNTQPITLVARRLLEAQRHSNHEFWPDDIGLGNDESLDWDRLSGHRQITDAYLLAMAVRHRGRFVTFDRRIRHTLVKGAQAQHLHIIQP